MELNRIYNETCLQTLQKMPDKFLNCVVTSPPYWGLRDYGHDDQIGLEKTPAEYVAKMVEIFSEIHRVLKNDGTVWLNLGDTYTAGIGNRNGMQNSTLAGGKEYYRNTISEKPLKTLKNGLKPKNLVGIPWRVAFALQNAGWYLRQDIIWNKPNPMPESVTDRCTKAHEYIFLLTKSAQYFFDNEAIKEPKAQSTTSDTRNNLNGKRRNRNYPGAQQSNGGTNLGGPDGNRNRRSIWDISPKPFPDAHFATFPIELPSLCILAGCPENGVVYDPFFGSGTTGEAALKYNRNFIGSEINPDYVKIAENRLAPHLQQISIFQLLNSAI